MRCWAALACVCLGADAASPSTLALWPQYLDAQLSLSREADGSVVVEPSRGGVLGTFDTKVEAESEVALHPLVKSVEIVWVPPTDEQSSVFDRFVANSPRFAVMNAVGIHLQVQLDGTSWDGFNDTVHERIEENIRGVLNSTLPSLEILPVLSKGFLAKSFCDFHTWKTSDPLTEVASPTSPTPNVCFSSSFAFVLPHEETSFFSGVIRGSNADPTSVAERAIQRAKLEFFEGIYLHRLAVIQLGRASTGPASSVVIEYLEVWTATPVEVPTNEDPWRYTIPMGETKRNILVVAAVHPDNERNRFEYVWINEPGERGDVSDMPDPLPTFEIQASKMAVSASAQASIVGDGFHRRYAMDLKLLEPNACGQDVGNKTILVRVPISATSYLDLDEIRRMERFGELKLFSFSKHIEIERPSSVSSQYVIGLEFTMSSESDELHVEYPIHFRYQAPSEIDLYRQASVIAPEFFLFCPSKDKSAAKTLHYLQTWGVTGPSDPVASSCGSRWLRLSLPLPLPTIDVLTPVGYLPSDWIVSSGTLVFASIGALLLLWVSVESYKSSGQQEQASWKAKVE